MEQDECLPTVFEVNLTGDRTLAGCKTFFLPFIFNHVPELRVVVYVVYGPWVGSLTYLISNH